MPKDFSTVQRVTQVDHRDFRVAIDGRDGRVQELLWQTSECHAKKLIISFKGQRVVIAVQNDSYPFSYLWRVS